MTCNDFRRRSSAPQDLEPRHGCRGATMEQPRIRLGGGDVWLELTRTGGDNWQITADWSSCLTADFTADLSAAETMDFAARMLSPAHSVGCPLFGGGDSGRRQSADAERGASRGRFRLSCA